MNKMIYLCAYGDFNNSKLLKFICNYFTQNIKHDELEYVAPLGGKNGDITCRNYIIKNGLKHIFLKPSQIDKPNILRNCTNAILFNNGDSKGITMSLKTLPKYIIGKIVEVHTNENTLSIYQFGKNIITKKYFIDNNTLKLI